MSAKEIQVKPITSKASRAIVQRAHYSGKSVNNSQLHLGVFYRGKLEGAMQFGPPMDKRKVIGLVEGTGWNEMLELNRMAFTDVLPRNSESRALGVAFRLIRKHYPHIKWVLSFSDATQCGDGTIYRASGFVLTQIKKNTFLIEMPDGLIVPTLNVTNGHNYKRQLCEKYGVPFYSGAGVGPFLKAGAKKLPGFQLRYIRLLDSSCTLTCPILPFSEIEAQGATMYKGKTPAREA